ncbi:MAG: ATP-binding protein, partial [Clostridia bacterium]|nr:ATP-binding protein [Clostridia bacterium]
ITVALDSEESEPLLEPLALTKYIKEQITDDSVYYVILDEIQKVKNFVSILNGLLRLPNIDIYVTGSNSKFLSSDIVTEFRGRGDEIRMYPLSFSEFYSVYDGSIIDAWKDYYTFGGLPLILLQKSDEAKMNYLSGQMNNVYINDVVERNNVQNNTELGVLLEVVSSSIGSLVNPLKLSNTFKSVSDSSISDKTIAKYLEYLQDAFIIEKAKRFDVKGKKYMETPAKHYFTDVGIRNAVVNFRQNEETHIMENIIYIELRMRGYNVDVGLVEIREKQTDGKLAKKKLEIDFIANKGNNKYYIQSAFNISAPEKRVQEERSLMKVNDSFKKIIVVRDDIKAYRGNNGILTMGLFEFLLNPNSLDA